MHFLIISLIRGNTAPLSQRTDPPKKRLILRGKQFFFLILVKLSFDTDRLLRQRKFISKPVFKTPVSRENVIKVRLVIIFMYLGFGLTA